MSAPTDFQMRLRAWFSEKHAKENGTVIYESVDGEELEVTCVGLEDCYYWEDRVFLGYVVRYLRQGRIGNRDPDSRLRPYIVRPLDMESE